MEEEKKEILTVKDGGRVEIDVEEIEKELGIKEGEMEEDNFEEVEDPVPQKIVPIVEESEPVLSAYQ